MSLKSILISLFIFLNITAWAQKRIEVLNANTVEITEDLGKDVKCLIGDVRFKHEDALMFCDSAYLNQKNNSLQAFSHVHIEQNDSLNLYGDYLSYSGNSKIARVRRNVILIHNESMLKTDSLDFNRNTNIGHYFNWGYLYDKDNHLQSIEGYYYSDQKDYYAVDSVTLLNPKYTICSDTLRYNTGTDISYFYGETTIESDSNLIYCQYGKYNTKSDIAEVSKNAYIINKDKKISGDYIFYNRNRGYGEAKNNVELQDTSMNMTIIGHYACLFEKQDSAYVTKDALLSQFGEEDTLYMHADTLLIYTVLDTFRVSLDTLSKESFTEPRSLDEAYQDFFLDSLIYDGARQLGMQDWEIALEDVLQNAMDDSLIHESPYVLDTIRNILAFNKVQIFSANVQARSDSICYSTRDSVIRLYHSPLIWSEEKQISAQYVEILTDDNKLTEMFLQQSAFIVLRDDSMRFNQVTGRNMRAYFNNDNQLSRLNVYEESKSVFFAREDEEKGTDKKKDKGDLVGVNNTESKDMVIYFKNDEPEIITLIQQTKSVLNPVGYLPIEETKLKGFMWLDAICPKSKADVFIWKEIQE